MFGKEKKIGVLVKHFRLPIQGRITNRPDGTVSVTSTVIRDEQGRLYEFPDGEVMVIGDLDRPTD